ncbi:hypothetical protein M432DRAFT_593824 [Thermoascus aurantiacus ATCC 26904]
MAPRHFTNPAPKTDSARSALSSFTCTLCNKSYSRQPEYEAHISSYDHQHRKRLRDLKQLSRDPNAAEKARRAEKKADAEAGLRVVESSEAGSGTGTSGGAGFKKGGFKSSFTTVKGPSVPAAPAKKNVLGDDDDEDEGAGATERPDATKSRAGKEGEAKVDAESDTDGEYGADGTDAGYYNPRRPTDCFVGCAGARNVVVA